MSFAFKWPADGFPPSFVENSKRSLGQALNSGGKLPLVADQIVVRDLDFGTIAPELDLLALEELSVDGGFRGRFMLSYSGDAFISLAANVQVNPLTHYKHALELFATSSAFLTNASMLVQLTISQLRLRCVIVLAFSRSSGLTLAFKDDPLESLNVSSTFDSIGVINQFIQTEIESQLRERFRRDLPSLIHRLSQKWLADMGHHAPTPAPITVEREEREPDDSFHEWGVPGELPGDLVEQEERKNASMTAGSDGEVEESDSEDESDEDEVLLGTSFSQSPAKRDQLLQPPSPSKSSSTPPRPIPNLPMRSYSRGSDSPILSSLKRTDSTFATTFSKASASEPFDMSNLDQLSSSLLVSSGERQARRKRFHRLDSVSPSTSPSKSTSLKQKGKQREKQRMIIKQSELDEYFPIRSASSAIPSIAHVPTSTKLQFDKEPVRGKSKAQAEVPSLRRGMMNSRLRSSEFFTPSYPK